MSIQRKSARTLITSTPQATCTTGKITQLTSRVSEFNPRVTIFEPFAGEGDEESSKQLTVSKGKNDVENEYFEEGDMIATRIRRRVKLENETDIADLEDLVNSPERGLQKGRRTTVQEHVEENEVVYESQTTLKRKRSTTASPSKAKAKKAKAKSVPQTLETPHPAPHRWRETYDTIKAMRSRFVAPVDTMGCDQAQTGETNPKVSSPLNGEYSIPFI